MGNSTGLLRENLLEEIRRFASVASCDSFFGRSFFPLFSQSLSQLAALHPHLNPGFTSAILSRFISVD
jgi:hypothetical protein